MNGTSKTGGPAFPTPDDADNWGMSLRDYFATKALPSVLAQENCGIKALDPDSHYSHNSAERAAELWARTAYQIADAMIAERDQ